MNAQRGNPRHRTLMLQIHYVEALDLLDELLEWDYRDLGPAERKLLAILQKHEMHLVKFMDLRRPLRKELPRVAYQEPNVMADALDAALAPQQ